MNKDEIIRKNLDLHAEWMRYIFEHPEIIEKIPQGAQLIIIPNNDSALAEENNKTLKGLKSQGFPVVIVHIDSPKPITPQIEFA